MLQHALLNRFFTRCLFSATAPLVREGTTIIPKPVHSAPSRKGGEQDGGLHKSRKGLAAALICPSLETNRSSWTLCALRARAKC